MNRGILWRAALVQLLAVAALGLALGLTLPHSFFEDWGWVVGPVAWLACAAITATVLDLHRGRALIGALLAGALSGVGVLVGAHWVGVALAIAFFAAWCARVDGDGVEVAA